MHSYETKKSYTNLQSLESKPNALILAFATEK